MKILHFIYDHTGNPWVAGGGAVRAYELNRRLAERHDVTIICGKYPGAEDYREGNLKVRFIGTDRNNYIASTFSYAYYAGRYLRVHKDEADIVVEDFAPYNPIFSFTSTKAVILQLHQREGFNILRKYWLLGMPFYILEKCYPRFFQHILTVSETSKEKFSLLDSSSVISNGIDASYLSVQEGSEGEYILFLGRLEMDSKGLDILLDAFAHLKDSSFTIAGKGKDAEKVRLQIEKLGLTERTTLAGYVRDGEKLECIGRCMFMVVPSRFEAQGIVVLEAAAMGKPVVVSDIAELTYAVKEGFGISFRSGDANDLAEKIHLLAKNTELRKGMGKKGRKYAKDFTWDHIAEQYESYVTQVQGST